MTERPGEGDATWYVIPGREATRPESECPHGSLELLGADRGNNEYYRCSDCQHVLVKKGTRDYRELRAERQDHTRRQGQQSPHASGLPFIGSGTRGSGGDGHRSASGRHRTDDGFVERIREFGRKLVGK